MRLAAPVHRLGRARDIVRAGQAQPALHAGRRGQPALAGLPTRRLFDPVQARRQAVGIDLQVVQRAVRRVDQVGAAHGERVQIEQRRHLVEQRLEGMAHVDRAMAAHRAARRQVGVDAETPKAHRADAVQRVQQRAGVEDRHQPVAAVGAAALHDLGIDRGDLAAPRHAELQPDVGGRPTAVREERVLARAVHRHRAARRARQRGGDHLEVQRLDAVAEAAADAGLDDADARAVQPQHLRQRQVQVVRHLRHRMDGQPLALGVPRRDRGVQLDLAVRDLGIRGAAFEHQVGRRHAGVDVAEVLLDLALDVAAAVVVQQLGAVGARVGGREVGWQRLDVEPDRPQRRFGGGLVDRRHRHQRLAAVAHAIARQRPFVLRDRDHAVRRAEVVAADDGAHAGQRPRRAGVDAAHDAVRDRAAQDAADQRRLQRQVGGVARAAADLVDAVDQRRAHADACGAHASAPAARCTDSMIFT